MSKLIFFMFFTSLILSSCENEATINKNNSRSVANTPVALQTEVLTLGSFHFNFPNLDISKTSKEDQIDVLMPEYQKEIESIVDKLEKFNPTIIVIERHPDYQNKYDSLYTAYVAGKHELTRSEEQQIGFRLAKRLGLKQLHCADAWGKDYADINQVVNAKNTTDQDEFMAFFYNNPDSSLNPWANQKGVLKKEGILAELKRINTPEHNSRDLGGYLIGIFKYETETNNQFGPDFVTGWWFNRNLRIFRNIQRINSTQKDRILVIFGTGHMNLLNIFFEVSPEYELLRVNDYLN
jgi:hypothetical protein